MIVVNKLQGQGCIQESLDHVCEMKNLIGESIQSFAGLINTDFYLSKAYRCPEI